VRIDPVELEVFKHLFHAIAEEMGAALRRTAFSPNIKERRDYSCAVFDGAGQVLAMGDHMPVHLGSMPMSVHAAIRDLALQPGDVAMLNDPFRGGTHLPDITLVAPVFVGGKRPTHPKRADEWGTRTANEGLIGLPPSPRRLKPTSVGGSYGRPERPSPSKQRLDQTLRRRMGARPDFYIASRAHHADVGGAYAGSMGPCREIYQEGFRIPPVKIVRGGEVDRDVLGLLLNNVRTPEEREGDLRAQLAACHTGADRLVELCERYGLRRVRSAAGSLLAYSETMLRAFLAELPRGSHSAEDFLDDDGMTNDPVRIAVRIVLPTLSRSAASHRRPSVIVDFSGSSKQVEGGINAVEAITFSACFYVFRCLLREDVPSTAGLMRPVQLIAPVGTVVNASPPAAVAGGNVETSQRIVDVLLRALSRVLPDRVPAASSGTMNNLTVGGMDGRSATPVPFAYYETVAGGSGASAAHDGVSGVHTHMTNSLNTPAEALEYAYPFRITRYGLRDGSGGKGLHRGGDGIVRELEVLTDCTVTILSDRRRSRPYGLEGGGEGAPGRTVITRSDRSVEVMPGKGSARLRAGDRVRVETPGGGGWGRSDAVL
jgi:N-methylhydantoinase B